MQCVGTAKNLSPHRSAQIWTRTSHDYDLKWYINRQYFNTMNGPWSDISCNWKTAQKNQNDSTSHQNQQTSSFLWNRLRLDAPLNSVAWEAVHPSFTSTDNLPRFTLYRIENECRPKIFPWIYDHDILYGSLWTDFAMSFLLEPIVWFQSDIDSSFTMLWFASWLLCST